MTEQAATPPATAKPEKVAGNPGWLTALEKPVSVFGELFIFIAQSIAAIPRPPYRFAIFLAQLEFMSYGSLFVVGLTGLFTGMVLALQLTSASMRRAWSARRSSSRSRESWRPSSPAS
jgi:ABC-type transporter Mla maintaining outer membrane lipid asymmetry permease subunit MlaE